MQHTVEDTRIGVDKREVLMDVISLLETDPGSFKDVINVAIQGMESSRQHLLNILTDKDRAFIAALALNDKATNRGETRNYLRGLIEQSIDPKNASALEKRFLNEDF